jgi:hypothetical protein
MVDELAEQGWHQYFEVLAEMPGRLVIVDSVDGLDVRFVARPDPEGQSIADDRLNRQGTSGQGQWVLEMAYDDRSAKADQRYRRAGDSNRSQGIPGGDVIRGSGLRPPSCGESQIGSLVHSGDDAVMRSGFVDISQVDVDAYAHVGFSLEH